MLTDNVTDFLKRTHGDANLAEQVRNADSYEALVELAQRADGSAGIDELQAAFAARNAAVLAQQMIRRGMIDPFPLPPTPAIDRDIWNKVAAMDLSPVVTQLVNRKGWTAERAAMAERRYRRFYYMAVALPEQTVAPTEEIDEFWHQHILNTRRYARDCERIAGRFVHHTPSSGADPDESQSLTDIWLSTWVSYEALFGEPYMETLGAAFLQRWPNVGVA